MCSCVLESSDVVQDSLSSSYEYGNDHLGVQNSDNLVIISATNSCSKRNVL